VTTTTLADGGLNFGQVGTYLSTASHWWGQHGLVVDLRTHVYYTLIAIGIALLIALPLGLFIGHTGRGAALIGGTSNALRSVPAFGLLVLLALLLAPRIHSHVSIPGLVAPGVLPYFIAIEIVLIVLAIPPILTNTYAGVQNVDPDARDAAKGMGMTGSQVVRKVEFPNALPLIMSGIRSATLQVIATAIIAAYVPFGGGLGYPIDNGIPQINDPVNGYPAMVSGAIIVAALAVSADLVLNLLQRLTVSPGLSRAGSGRRRNPPALPEPVQARAS
jgi:osmoprotectant transport system permease protein